MCLFASQAESQPAGWSQHVHFSVTMVNQTDDKCNVKGGPMSHTFKASTLMAFASNKVLERAVLDDIRSTAPSMGYIINDTLIVKCDMTNILS